MMYIKDHFSREKYEETFISLWKNLFEQQKDISSAEILSEILTEQFDKSEVQDVLKAASMPQYKQALTQITQKAIDLGAFGAPFFWVRNKDGDEEPFFGSDRFNFMWEFLKLPWADIAIEGKAKL
jgi:glutathione S-transferase kappa 1